MPDPTRETESRDQLAAAVPGLIIGIVTAAISDLAAPLRLVIAALLAVAYWSWPRLAPRRRARQEGTQPELAEPTVAAQRPLARESEQGADGRRRRRWTPLAVALAIAILLNLLVLILLGGSLVVVLFLIAFLLALALPLGLADLPETLQSVLFQATTVSVGAALAIGGQPIVQEIVQTGQGNVFWHAGWRVSLDDPRLIRTPGAGMRLVIPATFENLGDQTVAFASPLVVSSQGKHYTEPGPGQDLPKVPGKARQAGTIAFTVDPSFRFDDAVLTVGQSDQNQAVVPLGRSGRLVSLAPKRIRISGKVDAGAHELTDLVGELRADNPSNHSEIGSGHRLLILHFSTRNKGGAISIIYGFDWELRVPNGRNVGASFDCGPSQPSPSPGTTESGDCVSFVIDEPVKGTYAFFVHDREAGAVRFTVS